MISISLFHWDVSFHHFQKPLNNITYLFPFFVRDDLSELVHGLDPQDSWHTSQIQWKILNHETNKCVYCFWFYSTIYTLVLVQVWYSIHYMIQLIFNSLITVTTPLIAEINIIDTYWGFQANWRSWNWDL